MNFLLDTNACIALINGKPAPLRNKFHRGANAGDQFFVSSVAIFELWYGVFKSSRTEFNTSRVETFLSGPVSLLPFDDEDAKAAGSVRAALEKRGRPIGAYDLLLAGQAIRHQMTLITANVSEFSRVKELDWEDWGKS
ncbi:MAG: VapC toxin family PIN domain ribonuclease [Acidobacteria bacterium]|nr:MAG: VapC toxin family PIN domain ribonuclease [Acidobacteriota bacterium]